MRGGLLAGALLAGLTGCSPEPAVLPEGTLPELERRSFAHRMEVVAHHFPGTNRPGKMQLMVQGERRYLFQLAFPGEDWDFLRASGEILDITDPRAPVVVNEDAFMGFSINLAWHAGSSRWVLMESLTTFGGPAWWAPGPRGVRFLDVTDPREVREISAYSTDGGDPERTFQKGSGTHRDYWDGGRYAYLGAAPNDEFHFPERTSERYSRTLQILDLEQIEQPKLASSWWVPGQRRSEEAARAAWRSADDPLAYDQFHGPLYVPERIESGGRYGYGGFGTFGVLVFYLRNARQPRRIGHWDTPDYVPGPMMPHHTVDPTRIDRGFVVSSPESLATECQEAWHDTFVIDVADPTQPKRIGTFPVPVPPPEAGYDSFCRKPGRFGPHNGPHVKAPGKPHPDFTAYTYFNGGLQGFSLRDPRAPEIVAWFVPPQGGRLESPASYERSTDSVFIEWDRRLIWLGTNHGLYLLSTPELGEPVLGPLPVERWSLPGVNEGHVPAEGLSPAS